MASGVLIWKHSDASLGAAIDKARAHFVTSSPASDAERRAHLRALLLDAFISAANLGAQPVAPASAGEHAPGSVLVVPQQPNQDRTDFAEWQTAILQGAIVLSTGGRDPKKAQPVPDGAKFTIETHAGDPPIVSEETALAPLAAVAIVAGVGIVAATVWQYFSQQNELEYVKITSDANVKKHAAELAAATGMVQSHLEREDKAGASIPWDQQELTTLEQLRSSTKKLADWTAPPLQTTPNTKAVTEKVGGAVENVGKGLGVGTVLALAIAAWALTH